MYSITEDEEIGSADEPTESLGSDGGDNDEPPESLGSDGGGNDEPNENRTEKKGLADVLAKILHKKIPSHKQVLWIQFYQSIIPGVHLHVVYI